MKDFNGFKSYIDWNQAREQARIASSHAKAFKLTKRHQQDSENAMLFIALLEQYHK